MEQHAQSIDTAKIVGNQHLKSGSVVKVKGNVEDGVMKAEEIQHLFHDMQGLGLEVPSTGIRALILNPDFSACNENGAGLVYDNDQLSSFLFEEANPTGNFLSLNVRSCSKGKVTIDRANSPVYTFNISTANCSSASYAWDNCLDMGAYGDAMRKLAGGAIDWNALHQSLVHGAQIDEMRFRRAWWSWLGQHLDPK